MAPEYATSGKLTDRSDVFSFGVVLLEIVTGRKPVDQTQPLGDESLVEWVRIYLLHILKCDTYSPFCKKCLYIFHSLPFVSHFCMSYREDNIE